MNWRDELLLIKKNQTTNITKIQADEILSELKISASKGFGGKVFGFNINPAVGEILNKQGLIYKTFTDGEFEESSVWFI